MTEAKEAKDSSFRNKNNESGDITDSVPIKCLRGFLAIILIFGGIVAFFLSPLFGITAVVPGMLFLMMAIIALLTQSKFYLNVCLISCVLVVGLIWIISVVLGALVNSR